MPESTLVIGNKNYSSWSLRPWIYMKQKGIPFVEKKISLYTEESRYQLEAYFSNYKVPVLIDNDLIIWDSLAILEYLADKRPADNGWPPTPEVRAIARAVSAEMHSSFLDLRKSLPMNCRKKFNLFAFSPGLKEDVARVINIWRYCRENFGREGPWLFGNFSIADAMFAPVAIRFEGYSVPLGEIEKEYVQTLLQHPAIIEWKDAACQEREIIAENEIRYE